MEQDDKTASLSVNASVGGVPRCVECGFPFKARRHDQRFCCKTCRQTYHNATYAVGKAARKVLNKG